MRFLIFVICCVFFVGCNKTTSLNFQINEDERLAARISIEVADNLLEEKGLVLCGTGGQMMDQIKMLALSFDYFLPVDIAKGRELLIDSVDKFVSAINHNEEIRPYLNGYPFSEKNVEIRIYIHKPKFEQVENGKICVISAVNGVLKYKITSYVTGQLTTLHKETYEEAVRELKTKQ